MAICIEANPHVNIGHGVKRCEPIENVACFHTVRTTEHNVAFRGGQHCLFRNEVDSHRFHLLVQTHSSNRFRQNVNLICAEVGILLRGVHDTVKILLL